MTQPDAKFTPLFGAHRHNKARLFPAGELLRLVRSFILNHPSSRIRNGNGEPGERVGQGKSCVQKCEANLICKVFALYIPVRLAIEQMELIPQMIAQIVEYSAVQRPPRAIREIARVVRAAVKIQLLRGKGFALPAEQIEAAASLPVIMCNAQGGEAMVCTAGEHLQAVDPALLVDGILAPGHFPIVETQAGKCAEGTLAPVPQAPAVA